jgi:hypothetical protein
MAVYNAWTVEYWNGTAWTSISNVQNLTCQTGRQLPTDQWPVSTANIRIRYPQGFASPLTGLNMDTKIRFFAPGRSSTEPSWTGWVTNLRVEYGIPYVSATTTGNADFLVLDCEGERNRIGRYNDGVTVVGGSDSLNTFIVNRIGSDNGLVLRCDPDTSFGIYGDIDPPVGTFNLNERLNDFAVYNVGRIIDGVRKKASDWATTAGTTNDPGTDYKTGTFALTDIATVSFSDTTNDATRRIYDQYEVDGVADNYFTRASIQGTYGGTVTPTEVTAEYQEIAVGATAPYRDYSSNAVGYNAATLQGTAGYWANVSSNPAISPSSISATTNGQHTQNLDTLGFSNLELGYLATKAVNVTFRGTTTTCRIEGVSVTADLDTARFTYYISPAEDTGWFILDDADYGVLDQNRLGLY